MNALNIGVLTIHSHQDLQMENIYKQINDLRIQEKGGFKSNTEGRKFEILPIGVSLTFP